MVTLYQEARAALRDPAFHAKKRLGQNFLVEQGVIDAIVRLSELSPADEILEIGPGLGFLTRRLVERARRVWAVEIDPFLVDRLRQSPLSAHPAFHLIPGDILKIPLAEFLPGHKIKLVANLPYSISTPVLFHLFEYRERFSNLILMLQKEVAERIAASPGTKSYGTLSVWRAIHGLVLEKFPVSPAAFVPRPKVYSMVLKIGLYEEPLVSAAERPLLRRVVRAAFGQRRKTMTNALAGLLANDRKKAAALLQQQGIDPRRRGETLDAEEFIRLSRAIQAVSEESI